MFNKESFSVAAIPSENQRYHSGIYLTPHYTAGTDGMRLMIVSNPKQAGEIEDFPLSESGEKAISQFSPIIISAEDAKAIEKKIPKKTGIPILHCAALLPGSNGKARFFTTDLNSSQVTSVSILDEQFPKLNNIWPHEKPSLSIMFTMDLLFGLLSTMKKAGLESAKFDLFDADSVVRITGKNRETGQAVVAAIMPRKS
jgi:hypothetical protein